MMWRGKGKARHDTIIAERPTTVEVSTVKYCITAIAFLGASLSLAAAARDTTNELKSREGDFNQALLHGDWKALEQIEADDLIFTNADGSVTHKSDDVAKLRSGDLKISSIDMSDVKVQDLGNVAVFTGQLIETARYKETDLSGTYRFTDVWAKRGGRWWLVTGQEARVPPSK